MPDPIWLAGLLIGGVIILVVFVVIWNNIMLFRAVDFVESAGRPAANHFHAISQS